MEYVKLGKSDFKISVIGLGMWQAGGAPWGKDVTDETSIAATIRAHELGINLFDTAEGYGSGHSEEVLGKAVKQIGRENTVIATKVHGGHLRYDDVIRACKLSLQRLGVNEIDLYQVHWPDPWQQVPLKETMRAMERLYKDGQIRAIAVSNFAVRDLVEARQILPVTDIVSDQVRYNTLQREIEEEVLPYCRRENISILAYSPLAQGALTGKYDEKNKPSDDVRRGNKLFTDGNIAQVSKLLDVLRRIGNSRGKTVAQVALNWLIKDEFVIPIPGAKNPKQVEENAGAAGWKLAKREIEEITKVSNALKLDYF